MNAASKLFITAGIIFTLMGACSTLFSCKSKQIIAEMPVILNNTSIDSTRVTSWSDFRVERSDTFIVVINEQGDTVSQKETHWNKEINNTVDSLVICQIDTIRVPVYITQYVTKTQMPKAAWWAIGILTGLIFGLTIVIWLVKKKAKQE